MDRGLPDALARRRRPRRAAHRRSTPRRSAATRSRSRRRSTSAASRRCRTRASTRATAPRITIDAARGAGRAALLGDRHRRRLRPASGAGQGHGFVNMADRVGAFGGTLRVDSAPGRGHEHQRPRPARRRMTTRRAAAGSVRGALRPRGRARPRARTAPCSRTPRRRSCPRPRAGRRRGTSRAGAPRRRDATAVIRRVASMPLIPGRLMSMSTRPGSSASNCSTASSPVTASPTTSNPGVAAITIFAARRNGIWSSTMSTGTAGIPASSRARSLIGTVRTRQPGGVLAPPHPEVPGDRRRSTSGPDSGSRTRAPHLGSTRVAGPASHRAERCRRTAFTRRCTSGSDGHAELGEERVDVLLDRPLRQSERRADAGVVAPERHLREHLALARGEEVERRLRARPARPRAPPPRAGRSPSRRSRPPRSRAAARRRRTRAPSAGRRVRRSRARAARARSRARRTG